MYIYGVFVRFIEERIVWQEVPGAVSLAFLVSGCPLRCVGCHSSYSWNPSVGTPLTAEYLGRRMASYRGLIQCVCFLGGDWQPEALKALLQQVRHAGLDTCLYSGYEQVAPDLLSELTFVKTGPWRQALGGLNSATTNQRFTEVRTGRVLNHLFQKGVMHVELEHRSDSEQIVFY